MPMRRGPALTLLLTLAALAAGAIPGAPTACGAGSDAIPAGSGPYEESYRTFEADAQSAYHAPPRDGIIFVGSSTIYCWALALKTYFPELPVWGFGFTGAKTPDILAAIPRLLVPCRPRVVVYYCGDNDLAYPGVAPQVAVDGFMRFAAALRTALPGTRVICLAIKPSPARAACWANVQTANAALKARCATIAQASFVDVATPMLDAQGAIRPELYETDGLHMVGAGYQLWTRILRPELDKRYAEASADLR
jgi:lysophospholipase L1-like esterase